MIWLIGHGRQACLVIKIVPNAIAEILWIENALIIGKTNLKMQISIDDDVTT
jgi:hypothetical protein